MKHGIAVIEVSEFNSEAICDLRAVWRPAWPQRPPKWLLYKAVIEYAHGYQPGQSRLPISNMRTNFTHEAIEVICCPLVCVWEWH